MALASGELEEAARRNNTRTVEQRLMDVREQYAAQEKGVTIRTPDESLNCLINFWTKHQTNMGSRWARVRPQRIQGHGKRQRMPGFL